MPPIKRPTCRNCLTGPNDFHGLCHPCRRVIYAQKKRDAAAAPRLCATCKLQPRNRQSHFDECKDCQANRKRETQRRSLREQRALRKSTRVCRCGCGKPPIPRGMYATDACKPKVKVKRVKRLAAQAPRLPSKPVPVAAVIHNPGVEVKRFLLPWSRWS